MNKEEKQKIVDDVNEKLADSCNVLLQSAKINYNPQVIDFNVGEIVYALGLTNKIILSKVVKVEPQIDEETNLKIFIYKLEPYGYRLPILKGLKYWVYDLIGKEYKLPEPWSLVCHDEFDYIAGINLFKHYNESVYMLKILSTIGILSDLINSLIHLLKEGEENGTESESET